ncbi:luxQ, partial [Symbiodinium sp. KB8]
AFLANLKGRQHFQGARQGKLEDQIIYTASAEELNLFLGTAVPALQMFEAPDDVDLTAKVKELGQQLGRVKKQIEEALLLPHPAALASSSVQKNLADLLESAMDEEEDEKPSRGNRHAAKPPASDAKRRRRLSNRSAEAPTDDEEDADEKTEPAAASK